MPKDPEVVDWNDMSEEDRDNAMQLLKELNSIMDKYIEPKDEECENSNLDD
jgi:predicted Fe-S protein YdhL (DUF1289 family)